MSVEDLVRQQLIAIDRSRVPKAVQLGAASPTGMELGGWRVYALDVTSGAGGLVAQPLAAQGYGFALLKAGSDPLAVAIDAADAGKYGPVYPGTGFMTGGKFTRLVIKGWGSTTAPLAGGFTAAGNIFYGGRMTLAVAQRPDVSLISVAQDLPGFIYGRAIQQAYNTAGNVPTLATDGVPARGASSLRVWVAGPPANTILTGQINWYWYDPVQAQWFLTDVAQPLPTGTQFAAPAELQLAHRHGRYFPSLAGITFSGGAGAIACAVQVFGEGGDLGVQDVMP
jgi:hypothetical protein